MKHYTKESLIEEFIRIEQMGWIETHRPGNDGGVGNTLEDLLGIEENNIPLPNANDWELKSNRKNSTSLKTLFHSEPSPRAMKFVPSILLPLYGWDHKKAGDKYPSGEKSFRQTINFLRRTDRGFGIIIDNDEKKILISFSSKDVDERHTQWLDLVQKKIGTLGEIDPQPYWGFRDLSHKAGSKLRNCFYMDADAKKINGKEYFHYNNLLMCENFSFKKFIDAMAEGKVLIDFDARTGHNHGTKFRMRRNSHSDVFENVTKIF